MGDTGFGQKRAPQTPQILASGGRTGGVPAAEPGSANKDSALGNFGLQSNPFSKSSVAGCLPLISGTRQAIAQLKQAIAGRNGLLVVTGEVGTGKTTVLNQLRAWLSEKGMPHAYLFNPLLDARNFMDFVLAEFGIRGEPGSAGSSFTHLTHWLHARHRDGAIVVLIIDEAQTLTSSVLQALGPLMNLESSGDKLLQVVLAGQPELTDLLRRPELRAIRQRVALRSRTFPLNAEETQVYVEARLRAAGSNGHAIFSIEALMAVHFYSHGIPRVINLLCEHALTYASAQKMQTVSAEIVDRVAREFQFEDARPLAPSLNTESMDATLRAMRRHSIDYQEATALFVSETQTLKKETAAAPNLEGLAHTTTAKPEISVSYDEPASHRPVLLQMVGNAATSQRETTAASTVGHRFEVVSTSLPARSRFADRGKRVSAFLAHVFRRWQGLGKSAVQRGAFSPYWKQTWASVIEWLNRPMQIRPR